MYERKITDCFSIDNNTRTIEHISIYDQKFSVVEIHRMLQDKADDVACDDDQLDITCDTPSSRSTDNIITLLNGWKITERAADHIYDGSISQEDSTYVCLKGLGTLNKGTVVQIYYDDKPVAAIQMTGNENHDGLNVLFDQLVKIPKTKEVWKKIRVDAILTVGKREYVTSSFTVTPGLGTNVVALCESARIPIFDWDRQVGDMVTTWVDKKAGLVEIPKGSVGIVEQLEPQQISMISYEDIWVHYAAGDLSLSSAASPSTLFRIDDWVELTIDTEGYGGGTKGIVTKLYASKSEVLVGSEQITCENYVLKRTENPTVVEPVETGLFSKGNYVYTIDEKFEGTIVTAKQYENTWLYAISQENVIKSYFEDELTSFLIVESTTFAPKKINPYFNLFHAGIFSGVMLGLAVFYMWHQELMALWAQLGL